MYGKCSYILAEHCHFSNTTSKAFQLIVKNADCQDKVSGYTSCARSLLLKLTKNNVNIALGSNKGSGGRTLPTVNINGKAEHWVKNADYMIEFVGQENVIVTVSAGLKLHWTGSNVYFGIDSKFENKTCGLCGTYNFNKQDDFHTKTGSTEQSVHSFSKHWIYKDASMSSDDTCHTKQWESSESPCRIYTNKEAGANQQCGVLKQTNGVFKDCHKYFSPDKFFKSCKDDFCKCDSCYCDVIESYAKICTDKGVDVTNWRKSTESCSASKFLFVELLFSSRKLKLLTMHWINIPPPPPPLILHLERAQELLKVLLMSPD